MADLVGEAFVRITADTTAMRQAIKRAGAQDGKAYGKAFNKEVDEAGDAIYRSTRKKLAAAMADPKILDRWAKDFDSVEEAAKTFRKSLDEINETSKFGAARSNQYRKALDDWEKSAIDARKAAFDLAEQDKAAAAAKARQTRELRNFFTVQDAGYKRIQVALRQNEKAVRDQERAWASYGKNLLATTKVEEVVIARESRGRWDAWRNNTVEGIDRVDRRFAMFNFAIGKAFGKGSRNNFLNWTGSMVQGLTSMFTAVPLAIFKGGTRAVDNFFDAFSASRVAGFGKLASTGKGLLSVFGGKGGLVGAFVGIAAGAFAIGKVLPGVISLMTMLGGVVTALVGSISIGLVGSLLAVVPAAAGAVAGLGGLASVFTQFFRDDDNKKFVEDFFKPFKDANKTYYPQVRKFLTNMRGGFDDLIKDMKPSIDSFFAAFDKGDKKRGPGVLADPATLSALSKWSDSLGRIANSFSKAATSFASGLIEFFVPILPYAERLGEVIRGWAVDFDEWATSPEGKKSITQFMDKAWIAADKLWRILGNIGGIIGDVFMGGEQTGTGFLNDILLKVQRLNEYLDTPEGQAKLEAWFGDVQQIGRDIGNLALSVGEIISNFNSPEGRANATAIMDAIVSIGDAAVKVSEVADQIGRIVEMLNPLKQVFDLLGMGKAKKDPTAPQQVAPGPTTQQLQQRPATQDALTKYALNLKVTPKLDKEALNLQLAAIESYQSSGVQIPIKGNEELWNQTKNTIAMTIFEPKQIPVEADTTLWDQTKGTVQAFVFDSKSVIITANADPAKAVFDKVKKWLDDLPSSKTIRVAGVNSVGGLTVNAEGAIYTKPTMGIFGEAGAEAIVPLDRPLSQVDPAVRALSAFAQGKSLGTSTGSSGRTRTINVHPGAIVVQSPHSNPELVAEAVLDRLVAFA